LIRSLMCRVTATLCLQADASGSAQPGLITSKEHIGDWYEL